MKKVMTAFTSSNLKRRQFLKRLSTSLPVSALALKASSAFAAGKKVRIVEFDPTGLRRASSKSTRSKSL